MQTDRRRGVRVVECARLESVCTETYRRFESSPLRQKDKECQKALFFFLVDIVVCGEDSSGEEIGVCRFVRFESIIYLFEFLAD